jgi:CheY-like chemotaxis protein
MAKILVIDDEESVRALFVKALQGDGHNVLEAPDGKIGLDLLRKNKPDLVVTDILMPEADGLEAIMAIRKEHPGIKVIAVSGGGKFPAEACLSLAEKLGAAEVLDKPVKLAELLGAVRRHLDHAGDDE